MRTRVCTNLITETAWCRVKVHMSTLETKTPAVRPATCTGPWQGGSGFLQRIYNNAGRSLVCLFGIDWLYPWYLREAFTNSEKLYLILCFYRVHNYAHHLNCLVVAKKVVSYVMRSFIKRCLFLKKRAQAHAETRLGKVWCMSERVQWNITWPWNKFAVCAGQYQVQRGELKSSVKYSGLLYFLHCDFGASPALQMSRVKCQAKPTSALSLAGSSSHVHIRKSWKNPVCKCATTRRKASNKYQNIIQPFLKVGIVPSKFLYE